MHLAIVGAAGMVGQEILKLLDDHILLWNRLSLVESIREPGKKINYKNQQLELIGLEEALSRRPDIAIFAAGAEISKQWAPKFAAVGCRVIDNSSAWRMKTNIKLIVPEINAHTLNKNDMIIANPNCSTIQLTLVLKPLADQYGLKRVVVSTYQSVSGTGKMGVKQLELERQQAQIPENLRTYPYRIFDNCIPHCDQFLENGYTKEEMKLINESRKILDMHKLNITATAVRVPLSQSHSESLNVELKSQFNIDEVQSILATAPGLKLLDDPKNNSYPMPYYATGHNEVFVGRIRRDHSRTNTLNLWIVADNLRKGAATNALQIAERLTQKFIFVSENKYRNV